MLQSRIESVQNMGDKSLVFLIYPHFVLRHTRQAIIFAAHKRQPVQSHYISTLAKSFSYNVSTPVLSYMSVSLNLSHTSFTTLSVIVTKVTQYNLSTSILSNTSVTTTHVNHHNTSQSQQNTSVATTHAGRNNTHQSLQHTSVTATHTSVVTTSVSHASSLQFLSISVQSHTTTLLSCLLFI